MKKRKLNVTSTLSSLYCQSWVPWNAWTKTCPGYLFCNISIVFPFYFPQWCLGLKCRECTLGCLACVGICKHNISAQLHLALWVLFPQVLQNYFALWWLQNSRCGQMGKYYMMCFSFPLAQLCCFGADVVFFLKIAFLINLLLQEARHLTILVDARRTRKMVKIPERSRW